MIEVFVRDFYPIVMAEYFQIAQLVHEVVKLVVESARLRAWNVRWLKVTRFEQMLLHLVKVFKVYLSVFFDSLPKPLNFVICLYKLRVFFEFALSLNLVDVSKQNIRQSFAAASLFFVDLHHFLIAPMAVPAVADVFIRGDIAET